MDLSSGQKLRNKIEELKAETGLTEKEIKQAFVKEYMLENEGKSVDEMFSEVITGKKEE